VVIVGSADETEVCYGRIEGADINAHKVPTPKPGTHTLSEGYWPQVKIILKRRAGDKTSIVHVVDSTRTVIGCLDVNTAIGLVPILDSRLGIRTSARILTRPKKPGDLPPGSETSQRYNLDLNLYGPRKYAPQIGRHLSQKQLWLRTPLFVEAGIELLNPHAMQQQNLMPRPSRCSGYNTTSGFQMRTVEEIRNDVIGMFDNLQKSENLPEMEADLRIKTALLPHQKQGLYFMTNKEKERVFGLNEADNSSLWRLKIGNNGQKSYYNVITGQEERQSPPQVLGGILADMMGLGKTLSILSLVIATLEESKEWAKKNPPLSEDGETPLKQNCKTTLLVSPLSTISNWEEQITQHIQPGTLKYHIYHGANRIKDVSRLAQFDLVITTYGSVASEQNKRAKGKAGDSPLEDLNWFRIVLDEAHMIREQSTLQSKAICRLRAQRRWAVTGTPVQNRLDDLGALIKFLRIKPFDEKRGFAQYILAPCKNADPEILPKLRLLVDSITLRRLKDRIDLPKRYDHIVRLDFNPEERELYEVFAKNASDRVKVLTSQREKILGGRAYVHILQSILRLRLICAHGRELLSEEDLKIMAGVSKSSAIDLDSDDDEDDDKPALTAKQAYDMFNLMRETNADTCAMCNGKIGPSDIAENDGESKDEVIGHMTQCYHILCNACIKEYKKTAEETSHDKRHVNCPICNTQIRISFFSLKQNKIEEDDTVRAEIKDNTKHAKELGRYNGPHTKTKALIEDLLLSKAESDLMPPEPPIKSVVFSGWTSHLDLIEIALSDNLIPYTRLDGKMSRTARSTALETFRTNPSILVILVSITAGGLGLNLTAANKVYVMEPQYNPAAEAQAIDRVHRLGQKREVQTVRYVMNDSFEEKMLELQEKKRKLASLSMDREGAGGGRNAMDKAEATKKRLEDLRSLFK
jgi:SNF2 family DNA or RNA helicase